MDTQNLRIGATTLQELPCILPSDERTRVLSLLEELGGSLAYLGVDDLVAVNPRLSNPAFEGHYVVLPDGDGLAAYGGVETEDAALWLFMDWFGTEEAA